MGKDPSDDSLQRASECIVIADYLIERRRFQQALELLIEAIDIAPEHPLAYAKRALVCDELGLKAQADADRQRVLQLASKPGYSAARAVESDAKASMERARVVLTGSAEPDDDEPAPDPLPSSGAADATAKASEAPVQPEPPAPAESAAADASEPALIPSPSIGTSDPTARTPEAPAQPEPPAPAESAAADENAPKPRPSSSSGSVASAFFTALMIGGALAAVIGGIIFAINELDNGGGSPALIASPLADTATPAQTITPAPTPAVTPIPTEVTTLLPSPAPITGIPFSLSSIQNAWDAAGFTTTVRGESDRLSGFDIGATDVSLAGPAGTGELTVLVYADEEAPATDWDLVIGELPDPKPGRALPDHSSIWWNSNIIAVVRTISGDITAALDAFFQVAP